MTTPFFLYNVTKGFTDKNHGNHDGWDFGAPSHTPVVSLTGGTVTSHTGWYPWGGEVDIKGGVLGPGVTETVAHVDRIDVKPGQTVRPGEQIALSGGEGLPLQYSNGPHVHYSLFGANPWNNDYAIDPSQFLGSIKQNGVGTMAGSLGDSFDIPGAIDGLGMRLSDAIGNAYSQAETRAAAMVKNVAWFLVGMLLVALGLGLLVLAFMVKKTREAAPEIAKVAKVAAL